MDSRTDVALSVYSLHGAGVLNSVCEHIGRLVCINQTLSIAIMKHAGRHCLTGQTFRTGLGPIGHTRAVTELHDATLPKVLVARTMLAWRYAAYMTRCFFLRAHKLQAVAQFCTPSRTTCVLIADQSRSNSKKAFGLAAFCSSLRSCTENSCVFSLGMKFTPCAPRFRAGAGVGSLACDLPVVLPGVVLWLVR
eukprot:3560864-Amphidinium_carterae.1